MCAHVVSFVCVVVWCFYLGRPHRMARKIEAKRVPTFLVRFLRTPIAVFRERHNKIGISTGLFFGLLDALFFAFRLSPKKMIYGTRMVCSSV